jgi:hypothetical protein
LHYRFVPPLNRNAHSASFHALPIVCKMVCFRLKRRPAVKHQTRGPDLPPCAGMGFAHAQQLLDRGRPLRGTGAESSASSSVCFLSASSRQYRTSWRRCGARFQVLEQATDEITSLASMNRSG